MRGRFWFEYLDSKTRLTQPLVREGTTPYQALARSDAPVDRFTDVKQKHGADAIAGLIPPVARTKNSICSKTHADRVRQQSSDSSARTHMNFVHASRHA